MILLGARPATCGFPLWDTALLCTLPAGHDAKGHCYEASDCPDGRHDDNGSDDQ